MHKFVRSLITEWRKLALPFTDGTVIVAVSGGADSMALLLAIHDLVSRKKLALRVSVAHFNHKLRGTESEADEEFVHECADRLGFDFVSASGTITRKQNLEEKAREERYEFLVAEARSAATAVQSPRKDGLTVRPTVLTGHTQNDQAETFLLNLIRGSGPEGLAAMKPVREMSENVVLARPLLRWATRSDTEAYCRDRDVDFHTDRMNDDEAFTRVRIRKTLLPLLADFNPRIVETLARTSELLQERSETRTGSNRPKEATPTATLAVKTLKTLSKPDLYTTIRSWLRSHRGNLRSLELKHMQSIGSLVLSQKSGKTVELPGGGRVIKHGGSLTFSNIKVEK